MDLCSSANSQRNSRGGVLKFRIDRRITIVVFIFSAFDNPSMQISALRLLCCLLPAPNRDTLKVLLEFLAGVAQCAEDSIDEKGNEVSFATHRKLNSCTV